MWKSRKIPEADRGQHGYMLLTLTLAVAFIAIASLAALPSLVHQIQRDREEELCQRGTQYMRAIKLYYRAMGRYPTSLEDLQSAGNMRFIRKLYKDPLSRDPKTGQEVDFKPLRLQDVMLTNGAQSVKAQGGSQALAAWQNALSGNAESSDSSDSANSQESPSSDSTDSNNDNQAISSSTSNVTDQNFGGAILGVASASKGKTIREFNKKTHYNEWYFIYDATINTAGPLVGPWQPVASVGGGVGQSPGGPSTGQHSSSVPGTAQATSGQAPTTSTPATNSPPAE